MYSVDKFAYRDDISVPAEVVLCVFVDRRPHRLGRLVYQSTNTRTDTLETLHARSRNTTVKQISTRSQTKCVILGKKAVNLSTYAAQITNP